MKTRSFTLTLLAAVITIAMVAGCAPKKPKVCKNEKFVPSMKDQAKELLKNQDYIGALRSAREAEQCKPDDPELYYLIGLIYLKREMTYDAIQAFEKSIEIDDGYNDSHMALGIIYLGLQRFDDAIEQFEIVAGDDLYPEPWVVHNNLGWAYMQKGDLALAETNLNRAKRMNPKFCPVYTNLGELYSKQGYRRKSIDFFTKSLELCPKYNSRAHLLLGLEYGKSDLYAKACGHLGAAYKDDAGETSEQALEYMRMYNCPGAYSVTAPR